MVVAEPGPDLGIIFMERAAPPDLDAISAVARQLGFQYDVEPSGEEVYAFDFGAGIKAIVTILGKGHPDAGRLAEGLLSPSRDELTATEGHCVVSVAGLDSDVRIRDGQMCKVLACVAAGLSSRAIMLGHQIMASRADAFIEMVMSDEALPLQLTVGATISRDESGKLSFLTHGLTRYGREEMLVLFGEDRRMDAYGFLWSIARWLVLDSAVVVRTGEMVGRTPDEEVKVRRTPSPAGHDELVMRLEL